MEGRSKTGFPENEEKRIGGQVFKQFWYHFSEQFGGECDLLVNKNDARQQTGKKDPQNENGYQ